MKLIAFVPFHPLPIPGKTAHAGMLIRPGVDSFKGWTLSVRGPSVFFVSPAGWRPGAASSGPERAVFEIPRSHCHLQWEFEAEDGFDGVTKFDQARASSPQPQEPPPTVSPAATKSTTQARR